LRLRSEIVFPRASAIGYHRFYVIRQSAETAALSAARRSAGSAARYSATVEAAMLATIPAAVRGRELYGGRL